MDSKLLNTIYSWPKKLRSNTKVLHQRKKEAPNATQNTCRRRAYTTASQTTVVALNATPSSSSSTATPSTATKISTTPSPAHDTITTIISSNTTSSKARRLCSKVIEQFPLPPAFPSDIVESDCQWTPDFSLDFNAVDQPAAFLGIPGGKTFTEDNCDTLGPLSGKFWSPYDRHISQGSDFSQGGSRVIIDALVDDLLDCTLADENWQVDEGMGELNDVLGTTDHLHPIIKSFVRAHLEYAYVRLGPEHIWLAILQSLSSMVRSLNSSRTLINRPARSRRVYSMASSASSSDGYSTGGEDLYDLWKSLRKSSDIPTKFIGKVGAREVRLFPRDMYGQHPLYSNNGAAPLVMAAAASGHLNDGGKVEYSKCGFSNSSKDWLPTRQAHKGKKWLGDLKHSMGIRGLHLSGTIQAWSNLCMLTQSIKERYTGSDYSFDWWLHRVHLLARDLADYFAAQDEFANLDNNSIPGEWSGWISRALFADKHSDRCMDGWLTALFAVDADGQKVHGSEGWAIDWNQVPSGVDLQRVSSTSKSQCWNNLYSGFVGVQQLSRSTEHSRSRTLHGEELESALGIAHDRSSTLTDSNDILGYSRSDGQTGFTPRQRSATTYDPQTVPTFGSADPLEFGHNVHAIAPLIGWALDKMH